MGASLAIRAALPAWLAVAGCAAPNGAAAPEAAPGLAGTPDCFYARDVQDFRVLGRSSVLVFAPDRRRAYRIEIAPPSFDLQNANGIAFAAAGGRICGYAGERLLLDGVGGRSELAVVDVRRLDPAAVDAASPPGAGTRPLPEPRPGAGPAVEPDPDDAGP